jgi:hypothetical protein
LKSKSIITKRFFFSFLTFHVPTHVTKDPLWSQKTLFIYFLLLNPSIFWSQDFYLFFFFLISPPPSFHHMTLLSFFLLLDPLSLLVTWLLLFFSYSSQPLLWLKTILFLLLTHPPPHPLSPFLVNSVSALDNVIVVETFF